MRDNVKIISYLKTYIKQRISDISMIIHSIMKENILRKSDYLHFFILKD